MIRSNQLVLNDATEWLGDYHPLAEQLGSADGLVELSSIAALLQLRPVCDLESLRAFIEEYQARILLPFELPAIERAHGHAGRNELRELVAFDQEQSVEPMLQNFAGASRRVGQAQLQKLRPLKDQRIVQRYLAAVEAGQAAGWHTLVYGLTLAIYSLPLRQGLLGYAHQMIRSFIYSGARLLQLSERECRDLFEELCSDLPARIAALTQPSVAG